MRRWRKAQQLYLLGSSVRENVYASTTPRCLQPNSRTRMPNLCRLFAAGRLRRCPGTFLFVCHQNDAEIIFPPLSGLQR